MIQTKDTEKQATNKGAADEGGYGNTSRKVAVIGAVTGATLFLLRSGTKSAYAQPLAQTQQTPLAEATKIAIQQQSAGLSCVGMTNEVTVNPTNGQKISVIVIQCAQNLTSAMHALTKEVAAVSANMTSDPSTTGFFSNLLTDSVHWLSAMTHGLFG